jgi:hypothetical protein
MRIRRSYIQATITLCLLMGSVRIARCYLLVEDIPHLTQSIQAQVVNYAQYLQQSARQLMMVENQVTQITHEVQQLERFGDPSYYVNLLGLGSFVSSVATLTSGVGNTISQVQQAANGAQNLSYTGNGLYSSLSGTLDRFGNPVRYSTGPFNKFQAFNATLQQWDYQQRSYNTTNASLQQQLNTAMNNLNAAKDLVSTQKYSAQVAAISAQINVNGHTTQLVGQQATLQNAANQNDAMRMQEASRQQMIQERETDLQNEASGFSKLIGGQ